MKEFFKKRLSAIVILFLISMAFFLPAFQNKILIQGDIEKFEGMKQEMADYEKETGKGTAWTGSMFSGMPVYTITTPAGPNNVIDQLSHKLLMFNHTRDAGVIFTAMLMMYILLICFDYGAIISTLGAIAYGFSSYFIIIMAAGHVTKAWAMAYIPIVLLSVLLLMKGKKLWGGIMLAITLGLEISSNHLQITYYLALLCLFVAIGYVVWSIKKKEIKSMMIIGAVALAAMGAAVLQNSASLSSNLEMSKTSIRGKSRLTSQVDNKEDKSSGLDRDYAFTWSYGKLETLTMLIPNIMGGESGGTLDKDSNLANAYRSQGYQVPEDLRTYTYWGDQPFTSGPVYFGAIICFLFIWSLFVVKNKYIKAVAIGSTIFFVILSWGKNFGLNDLLFHYMPLYNKFRTPSMALVIPQFTFVLMACMALKKAMYKVKNGEDTKELQKSLNISAIITGAICLIFAFPSLISSIDDSMFISMSDERAGLPAWYLEALIEDRKDLCSSDALRSLILVVVAYALIALMLKNKKETMAKISLGILTVAVLFDLWSVDRRYLDDSNFRGKNAYSPYQATPADQFILNDKDESFRVLTINNPFNDTHISYFHKSIGGYNAAKLRDYQDLIDLRIEPEMRSVVNKFSTFRTQGSVDSAFAQTPALNMLNMRYLIYNDNAQPLRNPKALGNAWFVKNVQIVSTADEEMTELAKINPGETALVGKEFENGLSMTANFDNNAKVELTSYKPDTLRYTSESNVDGIVLFSEVYYKPGWKSYIDGQEVEHFRANWLLRGLQVPKGKHEIVFAFHPETYWTLRTVGSVISFLLLFSLIGLAIYSIKQKKDNVKVK